MKVLKIYRAQVEKVFCGPTDDPFFVDLGAAFDLLKIRPGAPGNAGGGKDALAGLQCFIQFVSKFPIGQVTRNGSFKTRLLLTQNAIVRSLGYCQQKNNNCN
jgi:hypothetical protein